MDEDCACTWGIKCDPERWNEAVSTEEKAKKRSLSLQVKGKTDHYVPKAVLQMQVLTTSQVYHKSGEDLES